MEFIKEYAAGSHFPAELSYSCFFQAESTFYGLAAQRKQLYQYKQDKTEVVGLIREYSKIVPNSKDLDFFAYSQISQKNEISIYRLDNRFKELDCLKVKKLDGYYRAEDLWFDGARGILYLVYPGIILQYNCNGDCLGAFMSAPMETVYCGMCTFEKLVFVAYKRNNCAYVGMYGLNGSFKEQISLGTAYQFSGMQVIAEDKRRFLRLYVNKKGQIQLSYELSFQEAECPEAPPCTICPDRTEEESEIEVELIKDDDIGTATWYLEPACHIS